MPIGLDRKILVLIPGSAHRSEIDQFCTGAHTPSDPSDTGGRCLLLFSRLELPSVRQFTNTNRLLLSPFCVKGPGLVDPLIGVRPKIVTLSLDEICWQDRLPIRVVIIERGIE
jgi:hypothetical protein